MKKLINEDKIWTDAIKKVYEGGNQSYNVIGKTAIEETIKEVFKKLYEEAEGNDKTLDFLDKIENKFY